MKRFGVFFILLLSAAGFLLPFWPIAVAGILLAAFFDRIVLSLCIGILLDLAWGAPSGFLYFIPFPFTCLAVLAFVAKYFSLRLLFQKSPDLYR